MRIFADAFKRFFFVEEHFEEKTAFESASVPAFYEGCGLARAEPNLFDFEAIPE